MKQVRIEITTKNTKELNQLISLIGQIANQNPNFRNIRILWNDHHKYNNGVSEIEFSKLLNVSVSKPDIRKVLYRLDELNILKFFSKGNGKESVKGRRVA